MTEELVGDIRDEYDLPEAGSNTAATAFHDGKLTVDGGITLEDFADISGIELEDGPYETLAGYMQAHTGELGFVGQELFVADPEVGNIGQSTQEDGADGADPGGAGRTAGFTMAVTAVDGRRIQAIEVRLGPSRDPAQHAASPDAQQGN